jgi:hypothetical protein
LKRDRYSVEDSDDEYISANDNPNENGSDNSSSDEDKARNSHRHYVKKDARKKDSANESKSAKPTDIPKENPDIATDDLTQQLERLTILTQAIHNQQKNMQSAAQQLRSRNIFELSGHRLCTQTFHIRLSTLSLTLLALLGTQMRRQRKSG